MNLNELVVMVTGAASGMGKEFALSLAKDGANVFATDLNQEGLEALVAESTELPGEIAFATGNVAQEDDVVRMVTECVAKFGKVNGLINNAGIFPRVDFLDLTTEIWDRVMNVNLRGAFLCSQAAARQMVAHKRPGAIVNLVPGYGRKSAW